MAAGLSGYFQAIPYKGFVPYECLPRASQNANIHLKGKGASLRGSQHSVFSERLAFR